MRPLPAARQTVAPAPLENLDDYDIVRIYGAEYRGIVNYYLLSQDVWKLAPCVNAVTSMLKTLAAKHHTTVTKMAARHKAKIETSHGLRTCFKVIKHRRRKKDLVARFGGIPLKQTGGRPSATGTRRVPSPRKELLRRLRIRECELCEPGSRWQFTRSPVSRNSGNREQVSPHGRHSWRKCDGKRLSPAPHVMISSTRNPSRTRHKSLESLVRLTAHAGFGGRLSGKGPNYRDLAGQPTLQLRPLGMPTWSDKLVGEVVRLLLEAYYEPQFSGLSHGFRPRRGCHTALRDVAETWTGTTWFIEGDISDCFGSLDHGIMVDTLAEKIHDNRFLRLVRNMLQAGYLEDWIWGATLSGAPQGGVVSPILSNVYLHKLDYFVERILIPHYTRGERRASGLLI